ncbi:hypothetical protein [Thermocoleostomius sinensis]|jgi:hypothetical protein|uniref:Uncharacterized protein n=1 Tax=Thermocoleostomius sinensis A174 TaxID=2016057 RepID=A0A9E8ZPM6_9CYAN|nr:hypothetical protein [Thermocoleostomius sinensis]WAL62636.1 hypothetical protein OXH18_11785 [Thermocoleostomius sinensis A174]
MLGLLVMAVLAGVGAMWWFLRRQKREWISNHALVYVKGAEYRYPDLPLGGYGIPMRVKDSGYQRVEVVFPRLTESGEVEYIYSWHYWRDVEMATPAAAQQLDKPMELADGIAPVIREHLQIDAEISRLNREYKKVNELADLVSTSDLYSNQVSLYERALDQIENLLRKAEELENIYICFIRETLIGLQIASYDADRITSDVLQFDEQYRQLREEYLRLKETAIAHTELMR